MAKETTAANELPFVAAADIKTAIALLDASALELRFGERQRLADADAEDADYDKLGPGRLIKLARTAAGIAETIDFLWLNRDHTIRNDSPEAMHEDLLRWASRFGEAFISLDSWSRRAQRCFASMTRDEGLALRKVTIDDPPLHWCGWCGPAWDVAMRYADARRFEIAWALAHDSFGTAGTRTVPEAERDDQAALSQVCYEATAVPPGPLARRMFWLAVYPPVPKAKPTSADFHVLEEMIQRTEDRWLIGRGCDSLSPREQQVWDLLKDDCLPADSIARELGNRASEASVRGHVQSIRLKKGDGTAISRRFGGYFRPDAPPDWKVFTPTPRKRGHRA